MPSSFRPLMKYMSSRGGKRSSSTFMLFAMRLIAASWSCESRMVKTCGRPASAWCMRSMRLARPWNVPIHMPRGSAGSIAVTRVSISRAALLVNVTASTWAGVTRPPLTSQAMRVVSTRVFPLPAPARMSACSSGRVTAASCSGLRCSRCNDTGRAFYCGPCRIGALRRNFRVRDAILAAQLSRERLGFLLGRQAAEAHDISSLLALQRRDELRGVTGGAHLIVGVERGALLVGRDQLHFPLAPSPGGALARLDLRLLRPRSELRFFHHADGRGGALLALVELAGLVHRHCRLARRADFDLALDQANDLLVGRGFSPQVG